MTGMDTLAVLPESVDAKKVLMNELIGALLAAAKWVATDIAIERKFNAEVI